MVSRQQLGVEAWRFSILQQVKCFSVSPPNTHSLHRKGLGVDMQPHVAYWFLSNPEEVDRLTQRSLPVCMKLQVQDWGLKQSRRV